MIYDNNLEALRQNYQKVYEAIDGRKLKCGSSQISVKTAKTGDKIIVVNNEDKEIYMNSRYNPQSEADKYMGEAFDLPDEALLIMYGLSNGSYIRSYLEHANSKTKCVIYEPSIDIFLNVLNEIDITDILMSERVRIIVSGINDEEFAVVMSGWLQVYNKDTSKLMAAPKYIDIFRDGYEDFKRNLIDLYEKLYVLVNTAVDSGKRAVKNDIYNMRFLKGCRNGMSLAGKFPEDMTGIVVSAGPSLEKNIQLLKEAKGKALIFVVDSAISKVMSIGVTPDAIITVDSAKPLRLFEEYNLRDIPFFVDMDSNTEVLEHVKSDNYYFFSSDSVVWDELFKKAGSELVAMDSGGSVATAAIANMIAWGFKRIVMIGQDLAFTGNRMHAGEEITEFGEDNDRYTYVKDADGNEQIIRKDYYIYLRWIEEIAYRFSNIDFIDATEGGSVKKNTRRMTFREVIDTYCTEEYDISGIFKDAPRLFAGNDSQYILEALDKMKQDFKNMKKQMASCIADCRLGKRILETGENNIKELKRINASIKKTDEMIEDSDERMYIYKYMALAEVNMMKDMYEEEDDNIRESIRMYEKSRRYYEEITSQIPELIDMIDDCKKQIERGVEDA